MMMIKRRRVPLVGCSHSGGEGMVSKHRRGRLFEPHPFTPCHYDAERVARHSRGYTCSHTNKGRDRTPSQGRIGPREYRDLTKADIDLPILNKYRHRSSCMCETGNRRAPHLTVWCDSSIYQLGSPDNDGFHGKLDSRGHIYLFIYFTSGTPKWI